MRAGEVQSLILFEDYSIFMGMYQMCRAEGFLLKQPMAFEPVSFVPTHSMLVLFKLGLLCIVSAAELCNTVHKESIGLYVQYKNS